MKLIIAVIAAIAIRVLIPFNYVLNPVRFASPDSYYYARLVRDGGGGIYPEFLRALTLLLPWNTEKELLIIPLVFVVLTIIAVYFIGRWMWDADTGFIAALLLAVFPGEYLGRSIMGNLDQHSLEVYFTTTAVLCLMLFLNTENRLHKAYGIFGLLMSLYLYLIIWHGYFLFIGVFGLFAAVKAWQHFNSRWIRAGVVALVGFLAAELAIRVAQFPMESWRLTDEALPLFGYAPPLFSVLLALLAVGAIAICVYDYIYIRNDSLLFLIMWLSSMLVATLLMRRFAYYLVVPVALSLAYFLWGWLNLNRVKTYAASIAVVFIFGMMGVYAFKTVPVPSDDWMAAMNWIAHNAHKGATVTALWDYGYWIEYETSAKVMADPSQDKEGVKQIAGLFTTDDPYAIKYQTDYLLLDRDSLNGKYPAIEQWAGRSGENAYIKKLWDGDRFMTELYRNASIRIYR